MAEQPINQPHVGWSPDYKSQPVEGIVKLDVPMTSFPIVGQFTASNSEITQLKADLQMAKDAYAGAKREAMLEHARILGRAVKAEIEVGRLKEAVREGLALSYCTVENFDEEAAKRRPILQAALTERKDHE